VRDPALLVLEMDADLLADDGTAIGITIGPTGM
jgi:hypothetical protein